MRHTEGIAVCGAGLSAGSRGGDVGAIIEIEGSIEGSIGAFPVNLLVSHDKLRPNNVVDVGEVRSGDGAGLTCVSQSRSACF